MSQMTPISATHASSIQVHRPRIVIAMCHLCHEVGTDSIEARAFTQSASKQSTNILEAGVSVQLSGGRLALDIDATPTIDLWTIAPSYNAESLNEAMVADLLTALWLDLRASLASGLAFDLPLPVPGNLGGLAAGLRAFTSNITLTSLSWSGPGRLILDVGVTGELPR